MESCGERAFDNRFGKSGTSSEPGEEEFVEEKSLWRPNFFPVDRHGSGEKMCKARERNR